MLNNEAKLMLQGEDAKVQGLFKGLDMATQQISAQNAKNNLEAPPQAASAPAPAPPQGAPAPTPPPQPPMG